MGSVRKLAMFVVIGLVAISTAITVYTANEPNRRDNEVVEQEALSIQRGTSLYITYCLQCHGPAGLGNMEIDADGNRMGRPGAALNQVLIPEGDLGGLKAVYQSDDPVLQTQAEDFLRYRIMYGVPAEQQLWQGGSDQVTMPAFRHDLNVEQMNDIIYLIMHGDWNYVYNTVVHETGQSVCEATPESERTGACEGDMHDAVAYPTVPPTPAREEAEATPASAGNANTNETSAAAGEHKLEAGDSFFDQDSLRVKPGDTVILTNTGLMDHDIAVDELGINSDLIGNGESVTVTIPEDANPGEYKFYCTVPGHDAAGMNGTLIVEPAD